MNAIDGVSIVYRQDQSFIICQTLSVNLWEKGIMVSIYTDLKWHLLDGVIALGYLVCSDTSLTHWYDDCWGENEAAPQNVSKIFCWGSLLIVLVEIINWCCWFIRFCIRGRPYGFPFCRLALSRTMKLDIATRRWCLMEGEVLIRFYVMVSNSGVVFLYVTELVEFSWLCLMSQVCLFVYDYY